MALKDRFASEDPFVLPVLIAIARSGGNVADLNVVIQDNDFLRATTVTQQQVGLTSTPSNPVPNVTQVAIQTVGQDQNDEGGGAPCFLGNTLYSYWDGNKVKEMQFGKLAVLQERPFALSYDEFGKQCKGEILQVQIRTRFDYLHVTFEDHTATDVAPEHPYWTPQGYVQIQHLLKRYVYDVRNKPVKVAYIDRVEVPLGIAVYNSTIKDYANYVANGHRVKNNKELDQS